MKLKDVVKVFTGMLTIVVFTFFFLFVVKDSSIAKNAAAQSVNQSTGTQQAEVTAQSSVAVQQSTTPVKTTSTRAS